MREQCFKIFDEIDVENSGYLTSSEIPKAVQAILEGVDERIVEEFVEGVEASREGKITKDEFYEFVMRIFSDLYREGEQGENELDENEIEEHEID
jgi:Ca2+-binding EF-hand superfamily protein